MKKSSELIDAALAEVGMTRAELCRKKGWRTSQIDQRFQRGSMRADEFLEIMDLIGVDVLLRYKDKDVRSKVKGFGKRAKAMSGGVIYDTENADALSNSFYSDGINMYTDGSALELYIDGEGRYFFVEYFEDEKKRERVFAVNSALAAAFVEKYGIDIDKTPKSE